MVGDWFKTRWWRGDVEKDETALELVILVLPRICDFIVDFEAKYAEGKTDKRRDWWDAIRTASYVSLRHMDLETRRPSQGTPRGMAELAYSLDQLFSDEVKSSESVAHNVTVGCDRLCAIRDNPSLLSSRGDNLTTFINSKAWENAELAKKISGGMGLLTEWFIKQETGWDDAPSPASQPASAQRLNQHVGTFTEQVVQSLQCICHPRSDRKGRLKMRVPLESKPRETCVLLAEDNPGAASAMWHELYIHERSKISATSHENRQNPNLACICEALEYSGIDLGYRLDLVLDQNHLQLGTRDYGMQSCHAILRREALQTEVSLKTLLTVKPSPLPLRTQVYLGLILSSSLLDLWTSEGIRKSLRRDNIYLFHQGHKIPPLTFMGTAVLEHLKINHPCPEIAELGIALLEIGLGRLPSLSELGYPDTGKWTEILRAQVVLDRMPEELSHVFRKAIKTCLMPHSWDSDNLKSQQLLLAGVILPLEKDLKTLKKGLDPAHYGLDVAKSDEEASQKQDLERLVPEGKHDAPTAPSQAVSDAKSQVQSHGQDDPRNYEAPHSQMEELRDNGVYFDDLTSGIRQVLLPSMDGRNASASGLTFFSAQISRRNSESWSGSHGWLTRFSQFRRKVFPEIIGLSEGAKVRITVLDTGIDEQHNFIRKKGWKPREGDQYLFRDFSVPELPENRTDYPVDKDGHGTFVAAILLQMVPGIELSIARIGCTRHSIKQDAKFGEKLVRAIEHAVSTWNTEIISMSFGFQLDETDDTSKAIKKAIEGARRKGVLFFAATGNSGNTYHGLGYPARCHGVFKAFASDESEKAAHYGITNLPDQTPGAYFIRGSSIVSAWPSALRGQAKENGMDVWCKCKLAGADDRAKTEHMEQCQNQWTIMSGTSFATPILAGLVAALIYRFYNRYNSLPLLKEILGPEKRFKSQMGVTVILDKMSATEKKRRFLRPWPSRDPCRFFDGIEGKDLERIKHFAEKLDQALIEKGIFA